jgi:hypothetical protein
VPRKQPALTHVRCSAIPCPPDAAPEFKIGASINDRSGDLPVPASCGLVAGVRDKLAKDGQRPSQGTMP